jgi:hypothetical protein
MWINVSVLIIINKQHHFCCTYFGVQCLQYLTHCYIQILGYVLGFVVPCIFNLSNKNTQLDATINRKIYSFVVQILLNMFRALLYPSSGARQTAVAASGFRMNVEVEVFSAVDGLLVSHTSKLTRGCNGSLTGSR